MKIEVMIMKYGVAFAGGGVKSLSQLPFIAYLEEKNIEISAVSGTSAGALVATLVALGLKSENIIDEIKSALVDIENEKVFRISGKDILFNKELKHGLIDGLKIEKILDVILEKQGVSHISDVKIPLAITSVDLLTGNLIVFTSHPDLYHNTQKRTIVISDITLSKAMRASMSFPLVFGSMPFDTYALVDGGLRMNCPVPLLKDYGISKKIAVTMRPEEVDSKEVMRAFDVMETVFEIVSQEAEKLHTAQADYLFNIPVGHPNIFNTKIADTIIERGTLTIEEHRSDLDAFFNENKSWLSRLIRG